MAHPIAIADQAVRLFFAQWYGLRQSRCLSTKKDGSILVTYEVSSFSVEYQETPDPVINARKRRRRSGKSARLRRNINCQVVPQPSPRDQNESSLSYHSSNSSSRDKMQIESTNNIPTEMMIQQTPSTQDFPSSNNQLPIFCIRHENGCQNIITSYYTKYTAICDDCLEFLENKLKTTPFCHSLCPCCHHPSGGSPFSLCSEFLVDLEDYGWIEMGGGS